MGYFIFRGINSKDMGILISVMPNITKPKRREMEVIVTGRNGSLTLDEGCYEGYSLSLECGTRGKEKLDEIVAWLDGSGELILSTEPNKIYRGRIGNEIAISDVVYLYNSFMVVFKVQPFKYSVNAFSESKTITTATIFYNKGTYQAEPILTVYGNGQGSFFVNGKQYTVKNLSGSLTVNSEIQEVYKDNTNCNKQFFSDDFPMFQVGENEIYFTGGITKIDIKPNWRWL